MKLLFTLLLTTIAGFAYAQDQHLVPKDKWSKNLYLSDEFCAARGLKPGETNELLIAWNNLEDNARFSRVVDIRWYFSSPAEAANYLSKNISELSEKGEPVNNKIQIPGVANLRVFSQSEGQRKLNASLGIKMEMYFFLFTLKNYVAKVFVSSEKEITVDESAVFAKEAARRLNAAIH